MASNPITLTNGTTAYASDVETKVNPLYSQLDPSNVSSSAKTGSGTVFVLQTSPTLSTSLQINSGSSSAFTIYSDSGTTLKFKVDGTTGSFGIPSGQKFFVDGTALTGDTYIVENAPNQLDFYVAGLLYFELATNQVIVPTGIDFRVQPTSKIFLDGGGNTYFYEPTADNILFVVGGLNILRLTNSTIYVGNDANLSIEATKNFYLDGGGDTYLSEISANLIRLTAGGSSAADFSSTLGMLLPNINPPTANYANRNSMVKTWASVTGSTGVILASYNVSGVVRNSTGSYDITLSTAFASTSFAVVATPNTILDYQATATISSASVIHIEIEDNTGTRQDQNFSMIAIGNQ